MVFHSLDKVTSCYIHILPPLLAYCQRWLPTAAAVSSAGWALPPHNAADAFQLTFYNTWATPIALYLVWQLVYLAITELFPSKLLQDDTVMTSLRYFAHPKSCKKGAPAMMASLARKIGFLRKVRSRPLFAFYLLTLFDVDFCRFY
jgi:hypothetical protein